MAKQTRKTISKKIRFEVFKRDSFTCQYCSSQPPKVALEIDHIIPVSKNGSNEIDNLITACFDCNRGKSDTELSSIPKTLIEKTAIKKIAIEQYKEYLKILKIEQKQINNDIDLVESIYTSYHKDYIFSNKFRLSVKKFILSIGIEETIISMENACLTVRHNHDVLKYFCGICWNKIREL